tara:strand:+ start:323 stop:550 length:228 start_codon:yes stop_codon:yes gene_type:complete
LEITAEINGKDKVKPTPAPVKIAPIKNRSKIILNGPDCLLRSIPEKVNGELGLFIIARAKATAGRQYIAHPVKPQ